MIHRTGTLAGRLARAVPPLFGHIEVPFLRHAAGLVGAAFAASGLGSIVIVALMAAPPVAAGRLPPDWSAGTLFVLAGALWAMLMIILFPAAGLVFTAAHAALRLARRNFGVAYIVLGWIAGWLAATTAIGLTRSMSRADAGAAVALGTCGLVLGIAYWWFVARQPAAPLAVQAVDPVA